MVQTKAVWLEVDRQKREDRTQFFQRAATNLKKFNPLSDDFTQQTLDFLQQRTKLSAETSVFVAVGSGEVVQSSIGYWLGFVGIPPLEYDIIPDDYKG